MRQLLLILALLIAGPVRAEVLVSSTEVATPLLELYTSEGCSSCPPAEKWLAKQKDNLSGYIPVVFHVDYWDHLGWKDKWANAEHTKRQKHLASLAGAAVYTPGFFLNGTEWDGWRSGVEPTTTFKKEKIGKLSIEKRGAEFFLLFSPVALKSDTLSFVAHVVVTESGIKSSVSAGENQGEKLEHNFVVTQWEKLEAVTSSKSSKLFQWKLAEKYFVDESFKNKTLVAWIEREGRPIQSLKLSR